jgi:hypothetical protein
MFKVDHDGILHVLAEDASTEGDLFESLQGAANKLTNK